MALRNYITVIVSLVLNFIPIDATQNTNTDLENKFGEIIHVSVAFRHGDRSPYRNYPLNPLINFWKDEPGELFKTGEHRIFLLGKWFRKYYHKLLRTVRLHTDLRIDSSNVDRTLMSAQCFMTGFYTTNNSHILEKSLNWQPVPVHTTPKSSNLIDIFSSCPAVEYNQRKFFNSSKMRNKYDKFRDDFLFLEKHTGLQFKKDDMRTVVENLDVLLDTLNIEKSCNLTLPNWTKKVYPKTLENIYLKNFMHRDKKVFKIQRLMTGTFFKSLTTDMMKKSKHFNSTNTFHFYSGHDTNTAALLNTLKIYDGVNPPYGASLIFELRKKRSKYIITVQYMKSITDGPRLLQLPNCKTPCTLKRFLKLTKKIIFKNIEHACQDFPKK